MPIIRALDTTDRVPQAALGHLSPDAECGELGARGAPQVVQGERRQSVLHALQSGVQRIEPDVGHALAAIAPALREEVLAAGSERLDLPQPSDHQGHQWDLERRPGLRARGGKVPDRTRGRVAVEIKLVPPRAQQLALADAEPDQQLHGERVVGAEARFLADLLEELRQLIPAERAAARPLGAATIQTRREVGGRVARHHPPALAGHAWIALDATPRSAPARASAR